MSMENGSRRQFNIKLSLGLLAFFTQLPAADAWIGTRMRKRSGFPTTPLQIDLNQVVAGISVATTNIGETPVAASLGFSLDSIPPGISVGTTNIGETPVSATNSFSLNSCLPGISVSAVAS
jgi:hypothetical protein